MRSSGRKACSVLLSGKSAADYISEKQSHRRIRPWMDSGRGYRRDLGGVSDGGRSDDGRSVRIMGLFFENPEEPDEKVRFKH